jgi:beta-lactamase regulating signal transducer with metallopeptidase domain
MLNNIFTEILNMSISAGIIAVVVILLRFIMKNRINKTLILLFWAVVFIKLALPFDLPSPTSIFNALPNTNITHSVDNFILNPQNNIQTLNRGINTSVVAGTDSEIIKSYSTANPVTTPIKAVGLADVMTLIWFCGAFLLFLFFICNYIMVYWRFKEAIIIKNNYVDEFINQYKLKRKVRVLKSSSVKTPVVFAVFRPQIILPMDFDVENETALKHILTHEMQHIKRFDNLTNLIALLLLCLHWFNPIVWLSKVLLSKDIEAACDEGALRELGEQSKCEYAESLLLMAQHNHSLSPALFVAFGESEVKSRIKGILKYKKTTVLSIVLVAILICVVCLFFATNSFTKIPAKSVLSNSSKPIQNNNVLPNSSSTLQISMASHPDSSSQSVFSSQAGSSSQMISSTQSNPSSPIGKPSQLYMILKGAVGMYNFYCFDGSIYKIVGSSKVSQYASILPERVLVFDSLELSEKPIGSVNYPLVPDAKDTNLVYGVNGVPILKGVSKSRSIAIQMAKQYYCRADYFMRDRITYNNQQYLIVPVVLVGLVTQDSLLPYEVDKKIGTSNDGFDVYSLKNPQKPNELAVDIPGMSSGKLYPLAILNNDSAADSSTATSSN